MSTSGKPVLTVLNFSAGKQSSCILWMVLLGDIPLPNTDFLVLSADPGMENEHTLSYRAMMFEKCAEQGIPTMVAPGPNLYEDIVTLKEEGRTRLDNPPFWTLKADGSKHGKLMHKCTKQYKVRPMDRVIRRRLEEKHGIPYKGRPKAGSVEKWIGFSYDEVLRIRPSRQKYITFTYPLIDLKMTDEQVDQYYKLNGLPIPPRSVCNACFANGLNTLKDLHNSPVNWAQAVAVDEAVRDLSQIGIKEPVYVSETLIPLKKLAEQGFNASGTNGDWDRFVCDSGYCFV